MIRKARTTVTRPTCFYTHTFADLLLSCYPLGRSLYSSSDEGTALLGIGKVFTMKDLKFPVLLDKTEDDDTFVRERDPRDGGQRSCDLRCG